jgi:hypothetical protein
MRQLRNKLAAATRSSAHRVPRLVAVAACGVLVASACSGDDDSPPDDASNRTTTTGDQDETTSTTQAASSSTATTAAGEEFDSVADEIVARYEGYWDARFAANSPPNPDDAALREYATGEQLDHVIAETQDNLNAGVEFRRADEPADFREVSVISVDGDRAVVQECVVNDNLVVRTGTGEVVDGGVATYNVRGDMQRVDGEWRLAAANQVQRWEGVAGCALAG